MGSLRSILRESVLDDRIVVLEEPPIWRSVSETYWHIKEKDGRRDLTFALKLPHRRLVPGSVSIRIKRYTSRGDGLRYSLRDVTFSLVMSSRHPNYPPVQFGGVNYTQGTLWLKFIQEFYVPLSDTIVVDYRYCGGNRG